MFLLDGNIHRPPFFINVATKKYIRQNFSTSNLARFPSVIKIRSFCVVLIERAMWP